MVTGIMQDILNYILCKKSLDESNAYLIRTVSSGKFEVNYKKLETVHRR